MSKAVKIIVGTSLADHLDSNLTGHIARIAKTVRYVREARTVAQTVWSTVAQGRNVGVQSRRRSAHGAQHAEHDHGECAAERPSAVVNAQFLKGGPPYGGGFPDR
jgi:hypothetical protein